MPLRISRSRFTGAVAVALFAGCAAGPSPQELDAQAQAVMQASFRDQGIAKIDRLKQDASNAECSQAAGKPLPEARAKAIEAANLAAVKLPPGGLLGDWRAGERLAQDGRGMTWTDASAEPSASGGNCYNCHQISKAEVSFGTIGPSLYNYGKLRGITDPASPAARAVLEYTWSKLYNAKAFNACSVMPRFGFHGLLNETQLKNLMALLLDPQSPVNQ